MAIYKNPSKINRETAINIFSTSSDEKICETLVAVSLHENDWQWCQTQCLHFLNHANSNVRSLAVTCLGHIARIHRKLDKDLVITALKNKRNDAKIAGHVQDALEDIEMFIR